MEKRSVSTPKVSHRVGGDCCWSRVICLCFEIEVYPSLISSQTNHKTTQFPVAYVRFRAVTSPPYATRQDMMARSTLMVNSSTARASGASLAGAAAASAFVAVATAAFTAPNSIG